MKVCPLRLEHHGYDATNLAKRMQASVWPWEEHSACCSDALFSSALAAFLRIFMVVHMVRLKSRVVEHASSLPGVKDDPASV